MIYFVPQEDQSSSEARSLPPQILRHSAHLLKHFLTVCYKAEIKYFSQTIVIVSPVYSTTYDYITYRFSKNWSILLIIASYFEFCKDKSKSMHVGTSIFLVRTNEMDWTPSSTLNPALRRFCITDRIVSKIFRKDIAEGPLIPRCASPIINNKANILLSGILLNGNTTFNFNSDVFANLQLTTYKKLQHSVLLYSSKSHTTGNPIGKFSTHSLFISIEIKLEIEAFVVHSIGSIHHTIH